MKFGVVNKSTTVNRFVLHTLQRNITHLAVITNNRTRYFEMNWKRAANWTKSCENLGKRLKVFHNQFLKEVHHRLITPEKIRPQI